MVHDQTITDRLSAWEEKRKKIQKENNQRARSVYNLHKKKIIPLPPEVGLTWKESSDTTDNVISIFNKKEKKDA